MLPQKHRLKADTDIRATLKHGRRLDTPYIRITYSLHQGPPRIACVAGKSVDKKAVIRHRYQRWMRAAAAVALQGPLRESSYDMVWTAKPAIVRVKNSHALWQSLGPAMDIIYKTKS